MGYQQTGYVATPRQLQLLEAASLVNEAFGDTLDTEVPKILKTFGKENVRLSTAKFERVLALDHPKLNSSPSLLLAFQVLLADLLKQLTYIDVCPAEVDYVINPVMSIDDVIDGMVTSHLPVYDANILGGTYGTVDTLTYFFAEYVKDLVLVHSYKKTLLANFRRWIGDAAYRLTTGGTIDQAETTALLLYGSVKEGSTGFSLKHPDSNVPIPAAQNMSAEVKLAGELYKATTLAGPWTQHMRVSSFGSIERLTMYVGPMVNELKSSYGAVREYGQFKVFVTKPGPALAWTAETQLEAISSAASFFFNTAGPSPLQLKVPIVVFGHDILKQVPVPDITSIFKLRVADPATCRLTMWWHSSLRNRRIDQNANNSTMELAMIDLALANKDFGKTQAPHTQLDDFGMCYLTEAAEARVKKAKDHFELFLLPNGAGVVKKEINMRAFYYEQGETEILPAFGEMMRLPFSWFLQDAPTVVDYVAGMVGLLYDDKVRFAKVISMYHNCAVYKRVTNQDCPFDVEGLAKKMLRVTE
jgi:hypothetical protein